MVLPRPSARAAKLLPLLGATLEAIAGANTAIPAGGATVVAGTAITLTEGTWQVWGFGSVLMGAGAGQADLYLSASARTLALVLAAGARAGGDVPAAVVTVAPGATQVVQLVCFPQAACTVVAAGWFGFCTGVRAMRVG